MPRNLIARSKELRSKHGVKHRLSDSHSCSPEEFQVELRVVEDLDLISVKESSESGDGLISKAKHIQDEDTIGAFRSQLHKAKLVGQRIQPRCLGVDAYHPRLRKVTERGSQGLYIGNQYIVLCACHDNTSISVSAIMTTPLPVLLPS